MTKRSIRDLDVQNKRVLLRVDYNVPMSKDGAITDDKRILETLPTIRYLLDKNATIILVTHMGRPDGKIVESLRLDKIAQRLSALLGKPVNKLNSVVGPDVTEAVARPSQATSSCSKTCGSSKRRRTAPRNSQRNLPPSRTFMWTMRLQLLTGPIPRLPAYHSSFHQQPASCSRRRLMFLRPSQHLPRNRSLPSWAAPRSPTKSASSRTCSPKPTRSSLVAAWRLPS